MRTLTAAVFLLVCISLVPCGSEAIVNYDRDYTDDSHDLVDKDGDPTAFRMFLDIVGVSSVRQGDFVEFRMVLSDQSYIETGKDIVYGFVFTDKGGSAYYASYTHGKGRIGTPGTVKTVEFMIEDTRTISVNVLVTDLPEDDFELMGFAILLSANGDGPVDFEDIVAQDVAGHEGGGPITEAQQREPENEWPAMGAFMLSMAAIGLTLLFLAFLGPLAVKKVPGTMGQWDIETYKRLEAERRDLEGSRDMPNYSWDVERAKAWDDLDRRGRLSLLYRVDTGFRKGWRMELAEKKWVVLPRVVQTALLADLDLLTSTLELGLNGTWNDMPETDKAQVLRDNGVTGEPMRRWPAKKWRELPLEVRLLVLLAAKAKADTIVRRPPDGVSAVAQAPRPQPVAPGQVYADHRAYQQPPYRYPQQQPYRYPQQQPYQYPQQPPYQYPQQPPYQYPQQQPYQYPQQQPYQYQQYTNQYPQYYQQPYYNPYQYQYQQPQYQRRRDQR